MSASSRHTRTRPLRRLVGLLAALAVALLALPSGRAEAHRPTPEEVREVRFDPRLGAAVSLDLPFRDEAGRAVTLGSYFGARPVLLTLNYFSCENLCPLMVQDLASSLSDLPFTLGEQYTVLTVSIDPRDTPEVAAARRASYLRPYTGPNRDTGWHFLTGDQDAIDRLTEAVGFRYLYDDEQHDFAHPAGVVVLTPGGAVARYLYGLDYPPTDLRLALVEAADGKIGSAVEQVLLLCYHYDPATGRYTPLVLTAVRAGGVATLLGLGLCLGLLWRADLRRGRAAPRRDRGVGTA